MEGVAGEGVNQISYPLSLNNEDMRWSPNCPDELSGNQEDHLGF